MPSAKAGSSLNREVIDGGVLGPIDQPEVVIAGLYRETSWSSSGEPSR
ncbi:hypothetical protein OHA70_33245 [Kribbella sp. NBC_00382]